MSDRCRVNVGRRGITLLVCVVLVACSRGEDTAVNPPTSQATQAKPSLSPTPSPTPVTPLKTPERVASGAVTETRGSWDKKVQRITYLSSADNTHQPMMFYKPETDEARPLVVALHSWSNGYTQTDSVIYSEWCIANDWNFIHPHFRGPNRGPQTTGSELVIADARSTMRKRMRAWMRVGFTPSDGPAEVTWGCYSPDAHRKFGRVFRPAGRYSISMRGTRRAGVWELSTFGKSQPRAVAHQPTTRRRPRNAGSVHPSRISTVLETFRSI